LEKNSNSGDVTQRHCDVNVGAAAAAQVTELHLMIRPVQFCFYFKYDIEYKLEE